MAEPIIDIDALTKVYPSGVRRRRSAPVETSVTALSDVSLRIDSGEIFGLVGRNGYGKTTLVKCIAGLIEPTSGSIRVDGLDTVNQPVAMRRSVGLVTSEDRSCYWRLTGRQNLMFFARLHGLSTGEAQQRIDHWAGVLGVAPLLDRRVHTYSLGNRQRIAIIRALLPNPSILLLDEPSRSLDPIVADEFRAVIREGVHEGGRRTVLITSNNLADIEQLCARVGILVHGRLTAVAPIEDLLKSCETGEEIHIRTNYPAASNGLSELQRQVPNLRWERCAEQSSFDIRFRRDTPNGADLHWLLERLIAGGHRILDCEVRRRNLRDVMESLETEAQADE